MAPSLTLRAFGSKKKKKKELELLVAVEVMMDLCFSS